MSFPTVGQTGEPTIPPSIPPMTMGEARSWETTADDGAVSEPPKPPEHDGVPDDTPAPDHGRRGDRPKRKHDVLSKAALTLSIISLIVSVGSMITATNTASDGDSNVAVTLEDDASSTADTADGADSDSEYEDGVSDDGLECDLDGWHYAYHDGESVVGTGYDGSVLEVTFDLTNNTGADGYVYDASSGIVAYQNGVKLSGGYPSSGSDMYDDYISAVDTESSTIQDGTTVTLPIFFELEDTESTVTIQVGDLMTIEADIA